MSNEEKAAAAGLGGAGVGAVGSVGAVVVAGGGTSASAITTGLARIGGGSMLAGIGVCAAAPIAIGTICYGLYKWIND